MEALSRRWGALDVPSKVAVVGGAAVLVGGAVYAFSRWTAKSTPTADVEREAAVAVVTGGGGSSDVPVAVSGGGGSADGGDAVTLRIVNVTDVYKLDNFPSLKTLVAEKRAENTAGPTISVLTGDFLAPYLLSSLDKGRGMVQAMNDTPIDLVIWGNHEDDVPHEQACKRTREFKGTWLNSNMRDHETFAETQTDVYTVDVASPDGSHKRKVGFIGILSASPSLYRPSAFGGATIEDPYDTMAVYKERLEREGCDLVVPLCHLYVPQDHVTCERFDFPVVLSGHDHHVVDEVVSGTRLLKAGADANKAIVLDLTWRSSDPAAAPEIAAEVVDVREWAPDPKMQATVKKAYSTLDHLKHTQLCSVPKKYCPLFSSGSRARLCTVASFLFSVVRDELNIDDRYAKANSVDCVIVSGGNIRGGKDYDDGAFFSMEDLQSEIQAALWITLVPVPGHLLARCVAETHGAPNPGFLQFDDGVELGPDGNIARIGGQDLDVARTYRVATTAWDLLEGGSTSLNSYFGEHRDVIPSEDASYSVRNLLLSHFATNVWHQVLNRLDTNHDGRLSAAEIQLADTDHDGKLSAAEVGDMMQSLGIQVDGEETSFLRAVLRAAGDVNADGYLSPSEMS